LSVPPIVKLVISERVEKRILLYFSIFICYMRLRNTPRPSSEGYRRKDKPPRVGGNSCATSGLFRPTRAPAKHFLFSVT
jgi:hypothetical protein